MSSERDCGANYPPPPKSVCAPPPAPKGGACRRGTARGSWGISCPRCPRTPPPSRARASPARRTPSRASLCRNHWYGYGRFPRPQQNYEPGDPSEFTDAFFSRTDWFAARHKQVRRPRLVLVDGAPRRPHPQGEGGGGFHHWGGGGVEHSRHSSPSPPKHSGAGRSRPGKELVQRVPPGGGIRSGGNNGVSVCMIQWSAARALCPTKVVVCFWLQFFFLKVVRGWVGSCKGFGSERSCQATISREEV